MAHPQHTRNDPHAGIRFLESVVGHKSMHAAYIRGDVPDMLNSPANANIRLTTESLFDYFLGEKRTHPPCGEWSREAVS